MYAVIKTGGKQYKVAPGQLLKVELLDVAPGDTVTFNEVLMTAEGEKVSIGTPQLSGATVTAEVIKIGRAKKIRIIKMRRRKHHRKTMGHRQWFTQVKITEIKAA